MPITALPSLVRTSPTFKTEVDTYFGTQIPTFSVEAEAARVEINNNTVTTAANTATAVAAKDTAVIAAGQAQSIANAPQYTDTSTTSLTIGTGTKVFTITAGKSYGSGMTLVASNGINSMTGTVTSYVGTTLTLNVTSTLGSGTFASWTIGLAVVPAVGSGGTTITGNVTLTASSPGAMTVINDTTPGTYITLPDATTCQESAVLFSVFNNSDFDKGIKDSAGNKLGWLRPRTGAAFGLSDNSIAAGVWSCYGALEKTGTTAATSNFTITGTGGITQVLSLDSNRICILFGSTSYYAIVYDSSTLSWGNPTLVRTGIVNGVGFAGVVSAANQILVFSCDSGGTAGQAVTLTISGTGVTVNTPVAKTLPATINAIGQFIAVGSSFVLAFGTSTTSYVIAFTVAGTVPTVGTESVLTSDASKAANLYVSGNIVRAVSIVSASSMYCRPLTVSGVTLTTGTQAAAATTGTAFRTFLNGNGNIVCNHINNTHFATIFKLTGTVEAVSSVNLGTLPGAIGSQTDYIQVTASKTVFLYAANSNIWWANILTDTSGTASAGTEISSNTGGSVVSVVALLASGNIARFYVNAGTSLQQVFLDCSGTSPVRQKITQITYNGAAGGGTTVSVSSASTPLGVRQPTELISGDKVVFISPNSSFDLVLNNSGALQKITHVELVSSLTAVGITSSESFSQTGLLGGTGPGFNIQKVEVAA